jgi:hypothetical protein
VPVLERHPEGLSTLPGWCWLDLPGKVQHVAEHLLEFTRSPPRDRVEIRLLSHSPRLTW